MNWKFKTEDNNISLHDHLISSMSIGKDIVLIFDDGFDVTKENIYNQTGCHKRTGSSAVILHDAIYVKGVKFLTEASETNIAIEELGNIDFEVLEFCYDSITKKVEICGDAWDECLFSKLEFTCNKVSYCWNEFVDNAWFQDWNKDKL